MMKLVMKKLVMKKGVAHAALFNSDQEKYEFQSHRVC